MTSCLTSTSTRKRRTETRDSFMWRRMCFRCAFFSVPIVLLSLRWKNIIIIIISKIKTGSTASGDRKWIPMKVKIYDESVAGWCWIVCFGDIFLFVMCEMTFETVIWQRSRYKDLTNISCNFAVAWWTQQIFVEISYLAREQSREEDCEIINSWIKWEEENLIEKLKCSSDGAVKLELRGS